MIIFVISTLTIYCMRYFGRDAELKVLSEERRLSESSSRFTLVMGRRRIGKTYIIRRSLEGAPSLYLLAMNESEETLCHRFQQQIEAELGVKVYGRMSGMHEVFDVLFHYATEQHLNLVIDEVQEFFYVRNSIFADMQAAWDKYKDSMHINMIVCGSIYSLMQHLFDDRKQAMYGRLTRRIDMRPFSIATLKQIMHHYSPGYTNDDLLCLYALTGGIPKYVETLMDRQAFTRDAMLQCFCDVSAPFVSEGQDLMNMEFRRESGTYYSILSLIAEGHTSIGEIESVLQSPTSAYLRNLEVNYSLLERVRPIFASARSQGVRYRIADNFMFFWFRFIYPYQHLVAMQRSDRLVQVVQMGYNQFIGTVLERYFRQLYMEEGEWTNVGGWWDARGTNEIDLVAMDDVSKRVCIAEVKMQKKRISLPQLEEKALRLKPHFKQYAVEYRALSVEDM